MENFMKIVSVGNGGVTCGRTDGQSAQTDVTKLLVASQKFCERA